MDHLSDRRRIERLIIVDLFAAVVRLGARDRDEPETATTIRLLAAARADLVAGIPDDRFPAMRKRLSRAIGLFERFQKPGAPVAEFGILAFHFARILVDRDIVAIGAESDLSQALDRLLPALEAAETRPGAEIVAEENAWRAMRLLQREGYFHEVSA